jgi:hypothetical protein
MKMGARGPVSHASSGATPFGFAFSKRGDLIVSEANGAPGGSAASSYDVDDEGNTDETCSRTCDKPLRLYF